MTSPSESKGLGIILGLSLIISAAVFGLFYYSAQTAASKDILSVTGSAKIRVTSDQAKLIITISRIIPVSTLSAGYAGVDHDLVLVRGLLKREGMAGKDIVESPVSMQQQYDNNGQETRYQLNQTVTVSSDDVNKLTGISKKIPPLADQGAIVSVQSLEYYYSKLPDLRVSLLSDAVKDAQARAGKIAEATGRTVGAIQSASNGVVQVLPINSVEISDYGSYDTSSIEKEVMVTLKASFGLK